MRCKIAVSVAELSIAAGLVCAIPMSAHAIEDANNFYLLGQKSTMAGYTPPPGTYVVDLDYYYFGSASKALPLGGTLSVGVDGNAFYGITSALWVMPHNVLGGNLGLGVLVPVGWKDTSADAQLDLPPPFGTTIRRGVNDTNTAFGDPLLTSVLGWHNSSWYGNITTLLNIPIGQWENGNIANIGFHHWGLDITPALTWLDPRIGFEISAAAGITLNWENPSTDYRDGTEFHLEFALMQHFSKQFAFGLAGYNYEQLTGDTGSGARLGAFKGRVTALGPVASYNFEIGKIPVSTSLKYAKEFDVTNRLEGNAFQFTLMMPLSGP